MNRLEGRVALVTGAASGIGKATAQRLADEGAAVLVTDIQVEVGEATVNEINAGGGRAAFFRHDVTSSFFMSRSSDVAKAAVTRKVAADCLCGTRHRKRWILNRTATASDPGCL